MLKKHCQENPAVAFCDIWADAKTNGMSLLNVQKIDRAKNFKAVKSHLRICPIYFKTPSDFLLQTTRNYCMLSN